MEVGVSGEVITHFTNTTMVVRAPVTYKAGALIQSLEGATIDVRAKTSLGAIVIGSGTLNETFDEVLVTFPEGALTPGMAEVQVWAKNGEQSQMIARLFADCKRGLKPVN